MTARAGGEELDVAMLGYELDGPGEPTRLGRRAASPAPAGEGVASDIDADRGFAIGDTVQIVGPDGTLPDHDRRASSEKARFSVQPGIFVSYPTFEAASRVKNPDALAILPSMVLADPEPGVSPSTLADRITEQVTVQSPSGQTIGVEALDRATAVAASPASRRSPRRSTSSRASPSSW